MAQLLHKFVNAIVEGNVKEAKKLINSDRLTAADFEAMISGLPTEGNENSFLKKYKVNDLQDSKKVNDDELRKLQEFWTDKYDKIDEIRTDPQFTFKSSDKNFYWLPENLIR